MSIHRVTTTALTTAVDGTWNDATWETIDLDTHVTVPSGAVAAIITAEVPGGTNRPVGMRTTGKTTAIAEPTTFTQQARSLSTFVVPLGSGNQVDLYASLKSAVNFYVSGFLSSDWTILDIDSPTTVAGNANTLTTTAISAAAASSTVLTLNLNGWWRPTSETTTLGGAGNAIVGSTSSPNTSFVKLNSSKEFDIACTTAVTVLGYCTTGVNWATWLSATELTNSLTKSAASPNPVTWTTGPSTFTGKNYVYIAQQNPGSLAVGFATRASGDSVPALATSLTNSGAYGALTPLTSGQYEYAAENTTHPDMYALLTFDAPSSGSSIAPLASYYAMMRRN